MAKGLLTRRQLEVIELVSLGLRDAEIAERLYLETVTVKGHLRCIYDRLGVRTRAGATREAILRGLCAVGAMPVGKPAERGS